MARERGDTERRAAALQDRLSAYRSLLSSDQSLKLKELLDFIRTTATREVVGQLVDREFQNRLVSAVSKTVQTPFDVDGKPELPWVGSYTIVALDDQGNVVGAVDQPCADGKDRYKFALAKAVCANYLELNRNLQGGLGRIENLDDLASWPPGVKPSEDIFMGSSSYPLLLEPVGYRGGFVWLGAGGCEVKGDYLKGFLKGSLLLNDVDPTHDTLAGFFDNVFCDVTLEHLRDPYQSIRPRPEPQAKRVLLWLN